jgi:uncharacterized membrane protein
MKVHSIDRRRVPRLAAAASSLLLVCAGAAVAAAPSEQRGFVSDGLPGGLLFERCDASGAAARPMILDDKSPGRAVTAAVVEVRQLMLDPGRPLYVEFRGEADGKGVMLARRFQRAIGHVASCAAAPALPPSVRLFVEGGEPAWRLQSSPAGARLDMVGKKPLQFQPIAMTGSEAAGKTRSFVAAPVGTGVQMRLELTEAACTASGSETAYGARVVAQLGEQRLEGCAARF